MNNISSIDLDGRESWNAILSSGELPSNLVLGVSLLYRDHTVSGVDTLVSLVPEYGRLVLAVPWLRNYLSAHPTSKIELRYANGRSLSNRALARLVEDFNGHGKTELAAEIMKQAADCAFIEIESEPNRWSRAVVLPNLSVVLWEFQSDSVLGVSTKGLESWECYGWRCAGAVLTPDGLTKR